MSSQSLVQIDDRTQVGEARRAGLEMAEAIGLGVTPAGKVALAVTEAATNIVKHAGSGKILLAPLVRGTAVGLEILALDRGPGISNITASMRDGYSTAGSMGSGLGALARVSPSFELYSQPGRGTALRLEVWGGASPPPEAELEVGGLSS